MKKLFRLTQSGLDELKHELETLMQQRTRIAERIKQARELGDLSENAEYQTAREEQDKLESRISEVDHVVKNAQIIKKPKSDGQVRLGSTVKLKSAEGKTQEFQVVGTMEADPLNGKISDESPIGVALMGKKVGDNVDLKAGVNSTKYKVAEIA